MSDLPARWSPRAPTTIFAEVRPAELAASEGATFAAELPKVLPRFQTEDAEQAQQALSHLITLLRASEDDAARLAERGFFRRVWSRLTGEAPASAAAVRARLGEVQARGLAVVERLLSREAFLVHATHHLGARIELLAVSNLKLKAALVGLGERVMGRVERLESRLARLERRSDRLERRVALSEIFQGAFSPSEHVPYAEIESPLIRLLTLARDFTDAAGGDWRPIDMHRLMRLATGEGGLDDAHPLPLTTWVEGARRLPGTPDLQRWVRAEGLFERLMAPLDDATRSARSFYPVHFLLQRPGWFVQQGLPGESATAVIGQELTAYGLDPEQTLTPWRLLQLLLEERLSWQLEAPAIESTDRPALAGPAGRFRTGGRVPEALFAVGERWIMLALDAAHGRPTLFSLHPEGPRPLEPGPPIAELPAAGVRWAVADGGLWILSPSHRAVFTGRPDGSAWRWRRASVSTALSPQGVAGGAGRWLAWTRGEVLDVRADRRRQVPRPVVAAAMSPTEGGGPAVGWLLMPDHVQRWPADGEPLEWVALPRGLRGVGLAVARRAGATPVVRARDAERRTVLVRPGPANALCAIGDDASFAPLPDGRVAVVDGGRLGVWSPGESERARPLAEAPIGVRGTLAVDDRGRIAVSHPDGFIQVITP